MRRRDFLTGMGAGFGAVTAGYVPMARASCGGLATPYRVLEINLRGGMSAFDTVLWSERYYDLNRTTTPGVGQIAEDVLQQELNEPGVMGAVPIGGATQYLWASTDALGPLTTNPLFNDRWRVVCMGHDFTPHEVAVPYALTGTTQGREYHAGMGAWVKDCPVAGSPVEPSYIFYAQTTTSTAQIAASVTGLGGTASPVLVPWNGGSADTALFMRDPQTRDGVVQALQGVYEERLQYHAGVRSSAYQTYESARHTLEDAEDNVKNGIANALTTGANQLEASVRTAIRMLKSGDARYICVVDSATSGGSPFDTHGHADYTLHTHFWPYETHGDKHRRMLAEALAGLAELSGSDLDNIMVIVTTEFGRYKMDHKRDINGDPLRDNNGNLVAPPSSNSEHWPAGYAQLVIGGEVGIGAPSSIETRLAGHIDDLGYARKSVGGAPGYTPAEFRAAMLYAAGIDVTGGLDELDLGPYASASNLYDSIVKN